MRAQIRNTTEQKSAVPNWKVNRERKTSDIHVLSEDVFIRSQRIWEGDDTNFREFLDSAARTPNPNYYINLIDRYLEGMHPDIKANLAYYTNMILINWMPPIDSGITLVPIRGYLDTLDKRAVNFVGLNANLEPIVMPMQSGDRAYFNCVMRRDLRSFDPSSFLRTAILSAIHYALFVTYLRLDPELTNPQGARIRNAQIIRDIEEESLVLEDLDLDREYAEVLNKPELGEVYLNKILAICQTRFQREQARQFYEMTDPALQIQPFIGRANGLFSLTKPRMLELYKRWRVTTLPFEKWYDMYSLDGEYPQSMEWKGIPFVTATGISLKYAVTFEPNLNQWPITGPLQTLVNLTPQGFLQTVNQRSLVGTDYTVTCYQGQPDAVVNQIGGNGRITVVGTRPLVNAPQGIHLVSNDPIKGLTDYDWTYVLTHRIVPSTQELARLIQASMDVRPTICNLAANGNDTYKVLVLPNEGLKVSYTSPVVLCSKATPTRDLCSIEGTVRHDRAYPYIRENFVVESPTTPQMNEALFSSLIGL